jgi:hypothetical protein
MNFVAAVIVGFGAVAGAWVAAVINRTDRSPEDYSKSIKGFAVGGVVWLLFCGYFIYTSSSIVLSAALVLAVVLIYLPTLIVLVRKGRARGLAEAAPEIPQPAASE